MQERSTQGFVNITMSVQKDVECVRRLPGYLGSVLKDLIVMHDFHCTLIVNNLTNHLRYVVDTEEIQRLQLCW